MNAAKFPSRLFSPSTALALAFFTMLFLLGACSDAGTPRDSKEMAEDMNKEKFQKPDERDAQFLVNATEIHLTEIQLGQLAQSNSRMKKVTELGAMMEREHRLALKDLEALAAAKQITVPATLTENGQKEYDKLKEKAGKEFDEKYCDKMVEDHKNAIDKFENAAKSASDADLRAWAANQIPAMQKHLQHAEECKKKLEKN